MHRPHLVMRTVVTLLVVIIGVVSAIIGLTSDSVSDKVQAGAVCVSCAAVSWIVNREYRF